MGERRKGWGREKRDISRSKGKKGIQRKEGEKKGGKDEMGKAKLE